MNARLQVMLMGIFMVLFAACGGGGGSVDPNPIPENSKAQVEWINSGSKVYSFGKGGRYTYDIDFQNVGETGNVTFDATCGSSKVSSTFTVEAGKQYTLTVEGDAGEIGNCPLENPFYPNDFHLSVMASASTATTYEGMISFRSCRELSSPSVKLSLSSARNPIHVEKSDPQKDTDRVDLLATVKVFFNKNIKPETLTTGENGSFIVTDSNGGLVEGVLACSNNMVTFDPDKPYAPQTIYTVKLTTDIKDCYGMPMINPYVFSFRTDASLMKLDVVGTLPENQAQGVDTKNMVITATFNVELAPDTVKENTFLVKDSLGKPVNGKVSASGKTVSFIPEALDLGTFYTVTLSKDIKSANNNIFLGVDYVFTFTTMSREVYEWSSAAITKGGDFTLSSGKQMMVESADDIFLEPEFFAQEGCEFVARAGVPTSSKATAVSATLSAKGSSIRVVNSLCSNVTATWTDFLKSMTLIP